MRGIHLAVSAIVVASASIATMISSPATAQQPGTLISVAFGPQQVWQPSSTDTVVRLQRCEQHSWTCIRQVMEQDGASADAIAFYRLTGWFLSGIQNTGAVQVGDVFVPWRANENAQLALLGGVPAVIYPEVEAERLSIESLPAAEPLKSAYPDLMFWPSGPTFAGVEVTPDGGQRLVLLYRVLNGCRACEVVARARVGFDFTSDGAYQGARILDLEQNQ